MSRRQNVQPKQEKKVKHKCIRQKKRKKKNMCGTMLNGFVSRSAYSLGRFWCFCSAVAFAEIIFIFNRQQSAEFCDMHENFCRFSICEIVQSVRGGLSCARICAANGMNERTNSSLWENEREKREKYFGYAAFACFVLFAHHFWNRIRALFRDGRRKKIEHRKHNMICMLVSLCADALSHCMLAYFAIVSILSRVTLIAEIILLRFPIHNLCSRANIDLQKSVPSITQHFYTWQKEYRMQFDMMKKLQCINFNNAHRLDNDGIKLSPFCIWCARC